MIHIAGINICLICSKVRVLTNHSFWPFHGVPHILLSNELYSSTPESLILLTLRSTILFPISYESGMSTIQPLTYRE